VDVLVEQYQRMRLDKNSGNNARKSWYLDPVFPLNFWLEKKLEWMDNSIPKGSYEDLNCSDELYKDVPSHHMIFTKVPRYHHFIIAQCKALWVATRNSFSTEDESAVPGAGATLPNKRLPAGRTPLQLGASLASVLQLPAITPPLQPDSSALSSHTFLPRLGAGSNWHLLMCIVWADAQCFWILCTVVYTGWTEAFTIVGPGWTRAPRPRYLPVLLCTFF
jgi:hypothetical protein